MKLVKLKNKLGVVYNEVKVEDAEAFLNIEFNSYKDAEQCTAEITDVPSNEEIKQSKQAQLDAIRSIKSASSIAQLKVALIELIKYLNIEIEEQ